MKYLKDIKELNLKYLEVDEKVVHKISPDMAFNFYIFPFKIIEDQVYIIAASKLEETVETYIKFIYKKDLKIYIKEKQEIYKILSKFYKNKLLDNAIEQLNKKEQQYMYSKIQESSLDLENAPAVKITNFIIDQGINMNASDIHIEPFENKVLVRFRVDGMLNKYTELPKNIYNFISTRIKIMGNMDISKKHIPLDGKIAYELGKNKFNLRVSTLPTLYGEKIVIRILYENYENIHLDKLGFNEESYKIIKKLTHSLGGMVLVTGPTGSGKTTTLYSILNEMDKNRYNITTIEDPVEYNMCYVNQVSVNNKSGLSFASGLRSVLRQDPDIILIGEIRDNETANIAVKAAMTGHLVLSTLHTKDSSSAVLRLMDMKIENYLLADTLLAVISQRLVRKICDNCRENYTPSLEEKRNLNLREGEVLYRGKGCNKCNGIGYFSRTVICEVMEVDDNRKHLIRNINSHEKVEDLNLRGNMKSLREDAIELVKKGVTTYEEVASYLISSP